MKEKLRLTDIIADAIGEALSNLHTATIAKVTAVQEKTISVQPVINRVVDGKSITLPQFTKVPPLFCRVVAVIPRTLLPLAIIAF